MLALTRRPNEEIIITLPRASLTRLRDLLNFVLDLSLPDDDIAFLRQDILGDNGLLAALEQPIVVALTRIRGDKATIGLSAHPTITIHRKEVQDDINNKKVGAA